MGGVFKIRRRYSKENGLARYWQSRLKEDAYQATDKVGSKKMAYQATDKEGSEKMDYQATDRVGSKKMAYQAIDKIGSKKMITSWLTR